MLLGKCNQGQEGYLSFPFKKTDEKTDDEPDMKCQYHFALPKFRAAYWDMHKKMFEGYQIKFNGTDNIDNSTVNVIFDVKCNEEEDSLDENVHRKIKWVRDYTIDDEKVIAFSYEGKEGCIRKEFAANIAYGKIKAWPQFFVGLYLLFFGSAHLGYALLIEFCLLGIGVT